MRKLIAVFVAASAAIGLLMAGCGSGSDSAADQQIDKATFVMQANETCKKASGKLAAEITSITSRESAKPGYDLEETQVTIVEESFIPRLEEELRQIRALGMPDEAKKETKALLKAYQRGIEKTKAKARALVEIEGFVPYEGVELAATRLGASECPVAAVNTANTN